MGDKKRTHFHELNFQEKQSKLSQLVQKKGRITCWIKGQKRREHFQSKELDLEKKQIVFTLESKSKFVDKKVLYTFELNGLSFFGQAKLIKIGLHYIGIGFSEKLYKSERRKNFRLMTYPQHKAWCHIQISRERVDNGNVLSIKTGLSTTGLFRNFLDLVRDSGNDHSWEGFYPFRVIDMSVAGLSILTSDVDAQYFGVGHFVGKMHLIFDGRHVEIPQSKVIHIDESKRKGISKQVKIGFKFHDVDVKLDHLISGLINQSMRTSGYDFEEFINN